MLIIDVHGAIAVGTIQGAVATPGRARVVTEQGMAATVTGHLVATKMETTMLETVAAKAVEATAAEAARLGGEVEQEAGGQASGGQGR